MLEVQVRKKFTAVEEIFHEGGPVSSTPLRRAAALAVIHNPFAGSYVNDIAGFMDDLKPLGAACGGVCDRHCQLKSPRLTSPCQAVFLDRRHSRAVFGK